MSILDLVAKGRAQEPSDASWPTLQNRRLPCPTWSRAVLSGRAGLCSDGTRESRVCATQDLHLNADNLSEWWQKFKSSEQGSKSTVSAPVGRLSADCRKVEKKKFFFLVTLREIFFFFLLGKKKFFFCDVDKKIFGSYGLISNKGEQDDHFPETPATRVATPIKKKKNFFFLVVEKILPFFFFFFFFFFFLEIMEFGFALRTLFFFLALFS